MVFAWFAWVAEVVEEEWLRSPDRGIVGGGVAIGLILDNDASSGVDLCAVQDVRQHGRNAGGDMTMIRTRTKKHRRWIDLFLRAGTVSFETQ